LATKDAAELQTRTADEQRRAEKGRLRIAELEEHLLLLTDRLEGATRDKSGLSALLQEEQARSTGLEIMVQKLTAQLEA
jgi:transcriptional antiterminator Rof (Rho-off)